jgi:hypothetical protein
VAASLGSYYHGDSPVPHARARVEAIPGRVHFLLATTSAHVGGPVVSKFFPDEAERFETLLGDAGAADKILIESWPSSCAPHAGILMMHAAPHAAINALGSRRSLAVRLSCDETDLDGRSTISLLWARTTSSDRARAFPAGDSPASQRCRLRARRRPQRLRYRSRAAVCVSSSFGCWATATS